MFVCSGGHQHDDELVNNWGREGNGDGLGPTPVCPAVVPNPTAPRTRNGDVAVQLCRRPLAFVPGAVEPPTEED